ncbi:response regulator [Gilvimarinus sp. SDUM040013]|uniref:Response regulator n=1 Tax=Gilvimarinus gilvus TaxID=3058038 RepID=A0ABU4RU50_9GAMM|nr:response regulator [Gilvimarinus sp. SDUM040013]MDO3388226.1 response regulator [Gilvimarinus sp. SDUM040013]MDX6847776.1 response regulator [Gilvimarinus sp. SDUM040013]
MTQAPLICVIEDEQDLAQLLDDYLSANGYRTLQFHTGDGAEAWLMENQADLILLDLMLPGVDGLQICKNQLNRNATPIIMMTAKVEEIDRLLGLELGADDYICKPYSPREVVARVKAVLRRSHSEAVASPEGKSSISLDEHRQELILFGKTVELTAIEFKLFALLYSQPGRIFSRQYILDNIYQDYRVVSDRTVDSHIKKLRKKLVTSAQDIELIRSVYGSGYKFETP